MKNNNNNNKNKNKKMDILYDICTFNTLLFM